jgi:hypothetical protein
MNQDRPPVAVRCFRAKSWIQKATDVSAGDIDSKFIFLWIAFNALYGQPKYLKREAGYEMYGLDEATDIKNFFEVIHQLDRRGQIDNAIESLRHDVDDLRGDLFLNKQCWIEWRKRELQSVLERVKRPFLAGKRDVGLPGLLKSLYVLRNPLFHGCSTDKGTKNREALKRFSTNWFGCFTTLPRSA